jgi:hypothetical protein
MTPLELAMRDRDYLIRRARTASPGDSDADILYELLLFAHMEILDNPGFHSRGALCLALLIRDFVDAESYDEQRKPTDDEVSDAMFEALILRKQHERQREGL